MLLKVTVNGCEAEIGVKAERQCIHLNRVGLHFVGFSSADFRKPSDLWSKKLHHHNIKVAEYGGMHDFHTNFLHLHHF